MEQLTLHQQLTLPYPAEFHMMGEEERNRLGALSDGEYVALSAPDLHIILSVGWKQPGGITGKLLDEAGLQKEMEKRIRKAQKPYGFQLEEYPERSIGGRIARGIRYTYKAQGVDMGSESLVLKADGTVYYFHIYYHNSRKTESLDLWTGILGSAEWEGHRTPS